MLLDGDYIAKIAKLAEEDMESLLKAVRETLGSDAVGMDTPSAEELAAFVFKQNHLYPPEIFTYPDGHTVFASPWVLALEYCTNGNEWVDKFGAFMTKAGVA